MQQPITPAMAVRDHSAAPAPDHRRGGLYRQAQPAAPPAHIDHVNSRQVKHGIDPRAVAPWRQATHRRLGHRRGPSEGCLVAPDPEGPRPLTGATPPARRTAHPQLRRAVLTALCCPQPTPPRQRASIFRGDRDGMIWALRPYNATRRRLARWGGHLARLSTVLSSPGVLHSASRTGRNLEAALGAALSIRTTHMRPRPARGGRRRVPRRRIAITRVRRSPGQSRRRRSPLARTIGRSTADVVPVRWSLHR